MLEVDNRAHAICGLFCSELYSFLDTFLWFSDFPSLSKNPTTLQ